MDYQSIKQRLQDIGILIATITTIATGLTAIWNLYLFAQSQLTKIDNENRVNLSSYGSYGTYLNKYRDEIQPALSIILNQDIYRQILLDKDNNELVRLDDEACKNLIIEKTKSHTGIELFGSGTYEKFRDVHNFYETLAFSLKNKVINFEIVFDLFTYPAYWDLQDKNWYLLDNSDEWLEADFAVLRPMRECIGNNYFGIDRPLKDFSDNIDQLAYNYLYLRLKYKFKNDCHEQDKASDICPLLEKRIQAFETNMNGNEEWKRLY
jgi:hypothetical protein